MGPNHTNKGDYEYIAQAFGGLGGTVANANLIAAAPELLEALEDLVEKSGIVACGIGGEDIGLKVKKAIAKAYGETKYRDDMLIEEETK